MNAMPACLGLLLAVIANASEASTAPYPKSDRITGITFHQDTLLRQATGSDIWSCSWASDGNIYAAYGDGGGFGGTDSKGRASIGVARLEGRPPEFTGVNVWGGWNPLSSQAATTGKGTLTAVGDALYLYVSEQGKWNRCRLWKSSDHGMRWTDCGWIFPESHKAFAFPGLVEFGRAQELNNDGFVYGFSDGSPFRVDDRRLYLFRVKPENIEKTSGYEYFSGTAAKPSWSNDIEQRKPVFENAAGISWGTTCVYHRASGRLLLAVNVSEKTGEWGLYEGEKPWGPWRTVAYGTEMPNWTSAPAEKGRPAYLHTFPGKWMSDDGKTLWCVFDRGDHFNVARCELKWRR